MNVKVLVTGSGGFIGGHLVMRLREIGARVFEIANRADCDLRNVTSLRERLRSVGVETIIHLASSPDLGLELQDYAGEFANTISCTANLLNAIEGESHRVIYVGSYKQYGHALTPFCEDIEACPETPYGLAKHCAELLVRDRLFREGRGTCLRMGPVYGPRQSSRHLVPRVIDAALGGTADQFQALDVIWDPVYVDDAIDAICACLNRPSSVGRVINVSGGVAYTVREVVARIAELMGSPIRGLPPAPPQLGGSCGSWPCLGDISLARSLLNWQPRTHLTEGLSQTIKHYFK